jgi:hypothetical protein
LVAALALLSAASYGQTPISSLPYYLTSPGAYVVTQDVSTGGIAIIINSANVTLDFNGHILTCTNPLWSTGVLVNQVRNVRIKNGTLTGFLNGIVFNNPSQIASNSSGHFVEEMHITKFTYFGIEAEYATGCVISEQLHQCQQSERAWQQQLPRSRHCRGRRSTRYCVALVLILN